jgi:hypothetical protein
MKPSFLWPNNSAAQSILKSTTTDPPKTSAPSITPLLYMHQKAVVEFTEEQLSAFLDFLQREKT